MTVDGPGVAALLESVPVGVVLVRDATVVGWNAAAEVLYGRRRSEAAGRPLTEVLFEPADGPAVLETLARVRAGEVWEGNARVRRADGVLLVSGFRAVPVGDDGLVAWVALDHVDQAMAEQERAVLLSAEHAARATAEEALGLVEAVVGSAPVGIAVFDLQLRYVRVNEAFAALSGLTPEEHVGSFVGEVVPLPPEVAADLRRVVTTGRHILDREVGIDTTAGGPRSFQFNFYPVQTTGGELIGAGTTVAEVTALRRAEAAREEMLAEARAAQRRLAVLSTASAALSTTMDLDEMLGRLARSLAPAEADWCLIELLGESGRFERAVASHRSAEKGRVLRATMLASPADQGGDGPIASALRSGKAQRFVGPQVQAAFARAAADRRLERFPGVEDLRSAVVVPIRSGEDPLGVLVLATEGDRLLGDDDVDLAVEVAHRAALAVRNARSYQQEHDIAENLQRGLLPASLPEVPGVELAVRYLAATEGALVGGDWYDVAPLDDGSAALAVGDVVGHDIVAASAVGPLRTGLRVHADGRVDEPAHVLGRLDRLVDQLGLPMATAVLAVLEPGRRQLRWSSAGHLPPLLVRRSTARYLEDGGGLPLGAGVPGAAPAPRRTASVRLAAGDTLLLCTDGLVERRGESIDAGMGRLARAVIGVGGGVEELCDAVLDRVLPAGARRSDDVVVLAARLGPAVTDAPAPDAPGAEATEATPPAR